MTLKIILKFVLKNVMEKLKKKIKVFLPTLLSCSSRFLRALQQNRAHSRLQYLLIKRRRGRQFKLGPQNKMQISKADFLPRLSKPVEQTFTIYGHGSGLQL